MRVRLAPLLVALFLLFALRPCIAEDKGGPASGRPTMPVGFSEVDRHLGAIDVDELKRTLGQIQISPQKDPPKPSRQDNGEKLGLTLETSITIALKNNLGVRIAELSKNVLQTEIPRAQARFHPLAGFAVNQSAENDTTDPESGAVKDVNTRTATPFVSTLLPTGANVLLSTDLLREETREDGSEKEYRSGFGVTVVQPLMRGGRIFVATKPIRDAEFDFRAEDAKLRAEILRVVAATKSGYYNLLFAEKVIEVTEAAIQRDKTLLEASESLFKAGLVTRRDVFSAEISLAKDSAKLASARGDLDSAQNALVNVLGLTIGTGVRLVDREIGVPPVQQELERWIAAGTRNRPEIFEINERLGKSELNVRTARNTWLPQLDLVGSYGRSGTSPTFDRSLDLLGRAWSVGLVFSVPLGNVAARAAVTRAELEHARLQQELVQRRRDIELEVRAAVIKLGTSVERMKSLTVVIEQAKGKLDVAKARFALGLATNEDITDAQDDLLSAETDLLKAIVDYNIGLAELEASVGGPI